MDPFRVSVPICATDQVTGFYMMKLFSLNELEQVNSAVDIGFLLVTVKKFAKLVTMRTSLRSLKKGLLFLHCQKNYTDFDFFFVFFSCGFPGCTSSK